MKDTVVRRCRHCPSDEFYPSRLMPIDVPLFFAFLRRMRCAFCGERQMHWLIPRPLRWALALFVLTGAYIASPGPVDWLHDRGSLSEAQHAWITDTGYAPLRWVMDRTDMGESPLAESYDRYRRWWSAPVESIVPSQQAEVTLPHDLRRSL